MSTSRNFWRGVWFFAGAVMCLVGCILLFYHWWSTPHGPRPLFHRWESTDLGWGWRCERTPTAHGDIFLDRELNMLFVLTGGAGTSWDLFEPGYAVLYRGDPIETRVEGVPNTLLLASTDGSRQQVALSEGEAASLYNAVLLSLGSEETRYIPTTQVLSDLCPALRTAQPIPVPEHARQGPSAPTQEPD